MIGISSLLVLLAYRSVLTPARLLPLLPHANETVPSLTIPVNATPALADEVLPGFKVTLNWASNFPMIPEDAYLNAIGFTYELASAGWEEDVPSGSEVLSEEVKSIRSVAGSLVRPGEQGQLQYKHVILGLLRMLNSMASRNNFCLTTAALYLYNEQIGQMAIGSHRSGNLAGEDNTNLTLDGKISIRNATESRSLTAGGRIVDPEEPNFVISYTLQGDPIPCQALLNAALNGMAQSAVMGDHDRCTNFAGFSSSGEVTYMINSAPPGTTTWVLAYILVRTALNLLPARLYEQGRCGEVEFGLIYRGEELGRGFIYVSDFEKSNKVAVTS